MSISDTKSNSFKNTYAKPNYSVRIKNVCDSFLTSDIECLLSGHSCNRVYKHKGKEKESKREDKDKLHLLWIAA